MLKRNPFPSVGKVIKYEIKNTWKPFTILYSIFAGITILNIILGIQREAADFSFQYFLTEFIHGLAVGIFAGLLVGIFVFTFINIKKRFKDSMTGSEAYITHTLPVTAGEHLWGRFIVAACWTAVTITLFFVCGNLVDKFCADFDFITSSQGTVTVNDVSTSYEYAGGKNIMAVYIAIVIATLSFWFITVLHLEVAFANMGKIYKLIFLLCHVCFIFIVPFQIMKINMNSIFDLDAAFDLMYFPTAVMHQLKINFWIMISTVIAVGCANFGVTHYIFAKRINIE